MYQPNSTKRKTLFWTLWTLLLFLLICTFGVSFGCDLSKQSQIHVQQTIQNYSSNHVFTRTRSLLSIDKWMDIRVFADTSLLMEDPATCYGYLIELFTRIWNLDYKYIIFKQYLLQLLIYLNSPGKYVRIGRPSGHYADTVCSPAVLNDCWKMCDETDGR